MNKKKRWRAINTKRTANKKIGETEKANAQNQVEIILRNLTEKSYTRSVFCHHAASCRTACVSVFWNLGPSIREKKKRTSNYTTTTTTAATPPAFDGINCNEATESCFFRRYEIAKSNHKGIRFSHNRSDPHRCHKAANNIIIKT